VGTFGLLFGSGKLDEENTEKLMFMTESFLNEFENNVVEVRKTVTVLYHEVLNNIEEDKMYNPQYMSEFVESLAEVTHTMAQNSMQSQTAYVYINPFLVNQVFDVYYVDMDGDGLVDRQQPIPIEYYLEGPTQEDSKSWYFGPVTTGNSFWSEPYMWEVDSGEDVLFISYTKPVYVDGKLLAIVGTDMRFDTIKRTIEEFEIYESGFAFLLNHELEPIIYSEKNYTGFIGSFDNKEFLNDSIFTIEYVNDNNEDSIAFIGELENGWFFGIDLVKSEITTVLYEYTYIMIIFMVIVLIISLFVSLRIARLISRPILEIVDGVMSSKGFTINLSSELLLRDDEIGLLSKTLSKMSKRIENDVEKLQRKNDVLNEEINKRESAENRSDMFLKILSQSSEGVFILDENYEVLFTNKAYIKITGYADTLNQNVSESGIVIDQIVVDKLDDAGYWTGELNQVTKDGKRYPANIVINRISDERILYFGIVRDMTKVKEDKRNLFELQNYDQMTNVPNFNYFSELILEELRLYPKEKYYLILCNIDKFRMLNGVLGVELSDELLKNFAARLTRLSGEDAIIGRVDGDEFAIFKRQNEQAKEWIDTTFKGLMDTYLINEETVDIRIGMGISEYPSDSNKLQGLLQLSKNALSVSKNNALTMYQFYSSSIGKTTEEQYSLLKNLRYALVRNELSLVYQPQIDVANNKIIGVEALMRWNLNGEMIPPEKFIPLAEEYNLIDQFGNWALEQAIMFAKELHNKNIKISMGINLSVLQLRDESLVDYISSLLEKYNYPPEYLELEITESILITGNVFVSGILRRLQDLGVKISIDDFGTGYSSLGYLHKYHFDKLKVDRTFIIDYPEESDGNIISLIINLAESIGSTIIAEGVEKKVQSDFLLERNCTLMQGYYYSKPLSKNNLIDFIKAFK